jgi:hypothetical protein
MRAALLLARTGFLAIALAGAPLVHAQTKVTPNVIQSSTPNPSQTNEPVTFSMAVDGTAGMPTGTVTMIRSPDSIVPGCENIPLAPAASPGAGISRASASCTTPGLPAGYHGMWARYSGDATYAAREGSPFYQTVSGGGTPATVTLAASPTPSTFFNGTVTLTATVSGGAGAPTGTVAFRTGVTTVFGCEAVPISGGTATCSTHALDPGPHSLRARYSGDATYNAVDSAAVTHNVVQSPLAPVRAWFTSDQPTPPLALVTPNSIPNIGPYSAADAAGNLYVVATRTTFPTCMTMTKYAAASGAIAWRFDHCGNEADTFAGSVAVDAVGNVFFSGARGGDAYVAKRAAADGALIWERYLPRIASIGERRSAVSIGLDARGNPRLATVQALTVAVAGLDGATGALSWETYLATPFGTKLRAFAVDAAGGVATADRRFTDAHENVADVVSRLSAAGALLWEQAEGGDLDAVAIDGAGNVVSSGVMGTTKRAAAGGSQLWRHPFRGVLAVDAGANVYVAGVSSASLAVLKLTPGGSVAWHGGYIDPNDPSAGTAISVDASGRLAVAGTRTSFFSGQSAITLRLDSADGRVVWFGSESESGLALIPEEVHAGPSTIVFGRIMAEGASRGVFAARYVDGEAAPPHAIANDLNADARSDILWHHETDGRVHRMLMSGATIQSQATIYREPQTAWRIVADGDFNGDGVVDLLWRNEVTGHVYVMLMTPGGTPGNGRVIHIEPSPAWRIAQAPDLDGDGHDDLVWWNATTGQAYAMLMGLDGLSIRQQGMLHREPDTAWRIVASGDFGATGVANQLVWRHETSGAVYLMSVRIVEGGFATAGSMVHQEPDTAWKILAAADFDGDGRSDLLWRNSSNGRVHVMLMRDAAIASQGTVHVEPDLAWRIVDQGDYDGDGRADLLWRHEQTGALHMMRMNGLAIAASQTFYAEPDMAWRVMGPYEYALP